MGRPKLPPGIARDQFARVRLNKQEHRLLTRAAKINGQPLGIFLRNVGLDAALAIIEQEKKRRDKKAK